MITLSKRKRGGKNKAVAVWSPTATGKTMVAVNIAAVMAKLYPTALVDLSPDNAIYTWLNCQESGLQSLAEGDPGKYYTPVKTPKLSVYSSSPGSKNVYDGETLILSNISKALDDYNVIFDTPRDYLKAANIISLVDTVIIVTDFNIHGTLLMQQYLQNMPNNSLFVLNRHNEQYPLISNPSEILQQPMVIIPDDPGEILNSILHGSPTEKYQELFQTLVEKVVDHVVE